MNIDLLNILFTDFKHDGLTYAYTGSFSDALAVRMIDIARHNIESRGYNAGLKNKVSFLMGECYQNIVKHGIPAYEIKQLKKKSNLLYFRIIGNNYYITSANLVENHSIENIKSKLERINSLSQEELKELQARILQRGELNAKGGAGLGIILMARKTRQKLAYRFVKKDAKTSIFYLQVSLQHDDIDSVEPNVSVSIDETIALHEILAKEGILLMHNGDFSQETFLPVLKMVEGNFEQEFDGAFFRTKLYHLVVEVLQNISKHGFKDQGTNHGVFTMGYSDSDFTIGSANYVANHQADPLRNRLEELRKLSKSELDIVNRESLKRVIEFGDESIGLGLIDIYRFSKSVNYEFDCKRDKCLFSLVSII